MAENPVLAQFKVPEWNVFLMTRFQETLYHSEMSTAVAKAVRAFGLEFVRADDPNWLALSIWQRVQFCLEACHLGIALFESVDQPDFNPNVLFELGYLLGLGRNCLLLKEKRLRQLPTDLGGHVYKEFDSRDIERTILGQVADWLKELGVRKRDGERLIVFVSGGGTCRCAMAKAITRELLENRKDALGLRVESRAASLSGPSLSTATNAARKVVQRRFDKDLLGDHHPMRAGPAFLFEADLILATDRDALSRVENLASDYPGTPENQALVRDELRRKSHLLTEFFEGTGDIEDPWPHRNDPSLQKYEECADHLFDLISRGIEKLIQVAAGGHLNQALERTIAFGARRLSP
jgi:protein-tyrosine-phosphatase